MLCIRFRFPCLHPSGSAGVSLASSPVIFPRDSLRTPKRRLFSPIYFILRGKRRQKSDKKALFYQFYHALRLRAGGRAGSSCRRLLSRRSARFVGAAERSACAPPAQAAKPEFGPNRPLTNPSFETHAYKKKPQRCSDSLQQGRFPRPVFPGRAFHSPALPILPLPAHRPARAPLPGSPGPPIPRLICRQQAGTGLLRYDASRNTPLTSMNP